MRYQNIRSALFGFVTKHACDRQTDGKNYDSQDRASIAASRGKKAHMSVSQSSTGKEVECDNGRDKCCDQERLQREDPESERGNWSKRSKKMKNSESSGEY